MVSTKADVHGQQLLSMFKTCYNIHLMSSSTLITITAKATLDQMLGAIFQRFEREGEILREQATEEHQEEGESTSKAEEEPSETATEVPTR